MLPNKKNPRLGVLPIPFVPDKVDLDDLKEGFHLYTQQERQQLLAYLNRKHGTSKPVRISKRELSKMKLPCKYSVVIADGKYQLLYRGRKHKKEAGSGNFGVVKYLQNLETGRFDEVVKLYSQHHSDSQGYPVVRDTTELSRIERDERDKLLMANAATNEEPIGRNSRSKGEQLLKTQQVASGVELEVLAKKCRDLHGSALGDPAFMLQIFINFARAVMNLHQEKKILHRDIKTQNVMVDPGTWQVRLIDFGLSLAIEHADTDSRSVGTPTMMAPEIFLDPFFSYGPKTEAFSFGATLARVLGIFDRKSAGFLYDSIGQRIGFKPSKLLKKDAKIQGSEILSRLYDLCEKLMDADQRRRLDIPAAQKELLAIQQLCVAPMKMVLINVADVSTNDQIEQRLKEMQGLKAREVVLLFDEKNKNDPIALKDALSFTRAAKRYGYLVHTNAFVIPDDYTHSNLGVDVKTHLQALHPGINRKVIPLSHIDQKYLEGLYSALAYLPSSPLKQACFDVLADGIENKMSLAVIVEKLKEEAAKITLPANQYGMFKPAEGDALDAGAKKFCDVLMQINLSVPSSRSDLAKLVDEFRDLNMKKPDEHPVFRK